MDKSRGFLLRHKVMTSRPVMTLCRRRKPRDLSILVRSSILRMHRKSQSTAPRFARDRDLTSTCPRKSPSVVVRLRNRSYGFSPRGRGCASGCMSYPSARPRCPAAHNARPANARITTSPTSRMDTMEAPSSTGSVLALARPWSGVLKPLSPSLLRARTQ